MQNLVLWIYLTALLLLKMDCKICTERKQVTITENQLHPYYVKETYRSCYFGYNCIKTRWEVKHQMKPTPKVISKLVDVCCPGYILDDQNMTTESIKCNPICMPTCTNGYCKNPGECACNTGYKVDLKNSHNCLPVCTNGCKHGTCEAPEVCKCNFGYNLVNGSCQPVCTEPCYNATCIEPENCQCHLGYRKSERNMCEPYCSTGCEHGSCIGPENCSCDLGWSKIDIRTNYSVGQACQPVCSESCHNGTCVAPDTCSCYPGYINSDNNKCAPHCSKGCARGRCVSPENCICDPGWYVKQGECVPHCDEACGNGTCIAPKVCDCFIGYTMDINKLLSEPIEGPLCIPICTNCEGLCVAPNKCVCESPYVAKHMRADGGGCDCFKNCSDVQRKCERTLCVTVMTSTTSVAMTIKDNEVTKPMIENDFILTTETVNWRITETIEDEPVSVELENNDRYYVNDTADFSSSNEKLQNNEPNWIQLNWIYLLMGLLLLLIVSLVILIIVSWKSLLIYLKGSSYVVEDDRPNAGEAQFVNIKFSSIVNKRESRKGEMN